MKLDNELAGFRFYRAFGGFGKLDAIVAKWIKIYELWNIIFTLVFHVR
jgi:hypothetical protein